MSHLRWSTNDKDPTEALQTSQGSHINILLKTHSETPSIDFDQHFHHFLMPTSQAQLCKPNTKYKTTVHQFDTIKYLRKVFKSTCKNKPKKAENGQTLSIFNWPFHHHTNAWNTWSLHILFIIISTSSDQTKNFSWSQKHIEGNVQYQANTWQKWKNSKFLTDISPSHQCLKYMVFTYFIHHDITFTWPNEEHLNKSETFWM